MIKRLRAPALWLYRYTRPIHYLLLVMKLIHTHGLRNGIGRSRKLPPGNLAPQDFDIFRHQNYFMDRAKKYGPVFLCKTRKALFVHVIGHALGRRLLSEQKDKLVSHGKPVQHLFPHGHLRGMHGRQHRHYRQIIVRALRPEIIHLCEQEIRAIIQNGLTQFDVSTKGRKIDNTEIINIYRMIMTNVMLRVLISISENDARRVILTECYDRFSHGNTPAYQYQERENSAYHEIRSVVENLMNEFSNHANKHAPKCVLQQLITQGSIDETVIGNLIYMVESGRFDCYSLLRWVTKYLSESPVVTRQLRSRLHETNGTHADRFSRAIILETLRRDQSEAITRDVISDVEFEGFIIPKGSRIRVCLWEGHKDTQTFDEPFSFCPERFLNNSFSLEQYAPFGIDHHRCIAADYVITLASLFVQELVRTYCWEVIDDGPPMRGAFHWEPSPVFMIQLTRSVE